MNHRGVEFTVVATPEPNVWRWQFRLGDKVMTGKTEAKLFGVASRRVQLRIDRALWQDDPKITRTVTEATWPTATRGIDRDRGQAARLRQSSPIDRRA